MRRQSSRTLRKGLDTSRRAWESRWAMMMVMMSSFFLALLKVIDIARSASLGQSASRSVGRCASTAATYLVNAVPPICPGGAGCALRD